MRRFLSLSLAALLLASLALASAGAATQVEARWVITDLGTVGGRDSEATAINNRGQIVGWLDQMGGGFLWESGKMRDLGTCVPVAGDAINDGAQILCNTGGLWNDGKVFSKAVAVNERGQIVGQSAKCDYIAGEPEDDCSPHAVLWTLKRG